MREHNRARLALIDARFGKAPTSPEDVDFDAAFVRVRDAVIRPVMDDVAAELSSLGHSPRITTDDMDHEGDLIAPCITLWVGQRGRGDAAGYVALGVARNRERPDVLAWLLVPPTPFDLERHDHPDEITADYVEQCLVDAVEHLFARQGARRG